MPQGRPRRARRDPRVAVSGRSLRLTVDHGEEALPGLLRALDAAGLTLQSIQLARPTLDDVFLTVTGRSLREDAPDTAARARSPRPEPTLSPGATDMTFARDTLLIFRRQMRLSLRNPAWVIIGLIQPILYLAFFGPLLSKVSNRASARRPAGNAYSFFVPGLLIQLGLFGAASSGFSIIADYRYGVIERLRVTLVSGWRHPGRAGDARRDRAAGPGGGADPAGLAFGLRAPIGGVLIGLGFIAVVAVSLSAISYTVGLLHEERGRARARHSTWWWSR